MGTPFTEIYDRFFTKITDDMYLEFTLEDTIKDLRSLLICAIPGFEFPRVALTYELSTAVLEDDLQPGDYFINEDTREIEASSFTNKLTSEEINILAIMMVEGWLQRQVTTVENIRMKYTGSDFKLTSQANHLSKLLLLQAELQRQSIHYQRLYKRRKTDNEGNITSNWSVLREVNTLGY